MPIVGYRWFEISAAGCAVLGKRPESSVIQDYLGWQDATIELPDDPQAGVEMIRHLLADTERMAAIHRRNYRENLLRNDWRHRFKAMFEHLGLPVPTKLKEQLDQLYQRSETNCPG
ncbi:MAG: glycosyltransferase family 1 protein [Leptolyngbyaceae cyanobacterium SM2_3_12]|nr:glycosyltransferase family 1 protein [Leptolyngbyaceae cyanobacterium SM2_3_12]